MVVNEQGKVINGLSSEEVATKHSAGLTNQRIDSISPSYPIIVLRNTFNLINILLMPLMLLLWYFERYKEILVIMSFAVVNSLVSMFDEIRVKRRLDQIRIDFGKKVTVIRDGKLMEILAEELVQGDVVRVNETEGVPTDGVVVSENLLQIDESLLTGESDYIHKEAGAEVLGGSFVVTGELYYRVSSVGESNYVNILSAETKNYKRERSNLQRIGNQLTILFVFGAVVFGLIAFGSSRFMLDGALEESILALVSSVMLIVPQTLIFLFTFTFSVSVLRLSGLGVLVQRGSAIETMSELDVICFDKTGTITTNTMKVTDTKYWGVSPELVAGCFNYANPYLFGKNKTYEAIIEHFSSYPMSKGDHLDQQPFTSRTKHAKFSFMADGKVKTELVYGAASALENRLDPAMKAEVLSYVDDQAKQGIRVILGIYDDANGDNGVWVMSLLEELNSGIKDVIHQFAESGTAVKIISGDSKDSVVRVLEQAGIDIDLEQRVLDLSTYEGDLADTIGSYDVYTRARPEDKLLIVKAFQSQGMDIGMVGDGVNDVLALKLSNLSIAMESGSKAARDVADVVLVNNNFELVPQILSEADNIIANLKFMNKLFISKTVQAILFIALLALIGLPFPLLPSSLLVFSFFGSSLPSYVVAFSRRNVQNQKGFWKDVLPFSVVTAIISTIISIVIYLVNKDSGVDTINTTVVYGLLFMSVYFASQLLYDSGYVVSKFRSLLIFLGISVLGVLATLVPLVRNYYDVVELDNEGWLSTMIVSLIGIIVYFLVSRFFRIK